MDVKCIADRIVETVNNGFQLGAQAIEIHRRCNHEHFDRRHFIINNLHVIFLAALMVFASKTRIFIIHPYKRYIVPPKFTKYKQNGAFQK